eukprot:scaffold132965_cov18-Tisochrysis_lutea.AAC.1
MWWMQPDTYEAQLQGKQKQRGMGMLYVQRPRNANEKTSMKCLILQGSTHEDDNLARVNGPNAMQVKRLKVPRELEKNCNKKAGA